MKVRGGMIQYKNVCDTLESKHRCHFACRPTMTRSKSPREPFIARHYELSKSFQWLIARTMIMSVANIRSAIGIMASMNKCGMLCTAIV